MPTLAEIAKSDDPALAAAFESAVIEVIEDQQNSNLKEPTIRPKTFDEVGPPLLAYVHSQLMRLASPANPPFGKFKWVTKASVANILRQGAGNTFGRLSSDVSRLLQANGLIRRSSTNRQTIYLAEWDGSNLFHVNPDQFRQVKIGWREEKRIIKAEENPAPIKYVINLRQIHMPDKPGPDEVMAFIKQFVPAALKLQDEYDELLARVAAEGEEAAWKEVSDELAHMLNSASEDTE